MVTSAALYHLLHFFHVTIDIRNVCVFLAPLFSSFTALVTYHLTKELKVGFGLSAFCLFKLYLHLLPLSWTVRMLRHNAVKPDGHG